MRKTKIICTLGPATDVPGVLEEMVKSGLNVARCNFSHADHEEHGGRMKAIKSIREKLGVPVGIMLDTKGPEIRIKDFKDEAFVDGKVTLVEGTEFTITTRELVGDTSIVSITYKGLPNDVSAGTKILIDDGLVALEVKEVRGEDIVCTVLNTGKLSNKKSVNVPNVNITMEYMSEKDKADIIFGCKQQVDYIAASFVRNANDVTQLRTLLNENGGEDIQIIAKIENQEGVDNIDEILDLVEGVMVARGDMGVEIDFAELPRIQKMIIKKAITKGKRAITATQMLETMQQNPRPTRAEVSDVANAVYDGTSCVMLSGESANGKYPVESVRAMAKIAETAEKTISYKDRRVERVEFIELCDADTVNAKSSPVTTAIAHATCTTSEALDANAIVAFTMSGFSARAVSSYRPQAPIIGATPSLRTYHQLSMSWGIVPVLADSKYTSDAELTKEAINCALKSGLCEKGDLITVTAGMPFANSADTNSLRVTLID